jgi:hypothetical protein
MFMNMGFISDLHDHSTRGRKPVLWDELAAAAAKQQYPRERLRFFFLAMFLSALVGCGRTDPFDYYNSGDGYRDFKRVDSGVGNGSADDDASQSNSNDSGEGKGKGDDGGKGNGKDGGKGNGRDGGDSTVPVSCDTDEACDDVDICTADRCVSGQCENVVVDRDNDGYIDVKCGGDDCNDLNPNVYPGHLEVCTDGSDNDCNGVADCLDPACSSFQDCGCHPLASGEICNNGQDDDCDGTVDCNDTDCMGTSGCACSADEHNKCEDGIDNDCDGLTDCDDWDCADSTYCICHSTTEICDNGEDDDCDLKIDCADPDCANQYFCRCVPPGVNEVCDDATDNDCDGLVDCADPDCVAASACRKCSPEICDDGIDNNCDNYIDCADASCVFSDSCVPKQELCNNQIDDDQDRLIDCADPDCANNPYCSSRQATCLSPKLITGSGTFTGSTAGNINVNRGSCGGDAGEAIFYFVLSEPTAVHIDSIGTQFDSALYVRTGACENGTEIGCDDDSGGNQWAAALDFPVLFPGTYYVFLDGFAVDPELGANEGEFQLNIQIGYDLREICDDGIDNDGDHYADCADSDCAQEERCKNCNDGEPPVPEFGIAACTDGKDNDCDGLIDCADDDCSASETYTTECCDGLDENDNGFPDDFNCRCVTNSDCMTSQICYDHTVFGCGEPCTNYFGDICPFMQKGSHCNETTNQCEF